MGDLQDRLRSLPSVDRLAEEPGLEPARDSLGRSRVVSAARLVLGRARERLQAGDDPGDLVAAVAAELVRAEEHRLRRVINATGVIVHTNLGRAPLAVAARERVDEVARGYSNLEFDLAAGRRGSRQDHAAGLLRELTGAEDALVVNNNAAALMLALAALAEGREVVVSRGELVEIGDGFRIPDVLTRSGARLVEVGSTNRTRLADYERAVGPDTAMLLRVHPSNFRILGFTERPALRELAELATRHGLVLVDDLGSGSLVTLPEEPTVAERLAAGSHLVTFSGDKLLGGPQGGLVAGAAAPIERLRRHPLHRALRADKLTIAALEGTLRLYRRPERARLEVPVLRMLTEGDEAVRERAARLASLAEGAVESSTARAGGGALPLLDVPSYACVLEGGLGPPLRLGDPPVVGIVRDDQLLLDCRTLTDAEVDEVAAAVAEARLALAGRP